MEVDKKLTRKDRIKQWWRIEGKIECLGAILVTLVLIFFFIQTLSF